MGFLPRTPAQYDRGEPAMMIGPEELGTQRREHHERPAGLAVADHAGLAVGLRMQRDDLLEEDRLGARDVLERLARHGLGQEANEVAGMAGLEGDADLAVGLEAADAGAVPGARIDDDEGAPRRIDRHAFRRHDAHEGVIDRPRERAAVDDELGLVVEHVRRRLGEVLAVLVAALAQHVEEEEAALRGVDHVFEAGAKGPKA